MGLADRDYVGSRYLQRFLQYKIIKTAIFLEKIIERTL